MASCSSLLSPTSSDLAPKRVRLSRMSTNEQIGAMKTEIRSKIKSLRDRLDAKECELIAEVDMLGEIQENERKEMEQQILELNEKSSFRSTHNRLSALRDAIKSTIDDLERELEQFQEIHSSWKTGDFESNIESVCSLSNVTNVESIYKSKSDPNWGIEIGERPSQLSSPTSLAIQQSTADVFVGDRDGNRIQVYNSLGEHIRSIEKISEVVFNIISVSEKSIFAIRLGIALGYGSGSYGKIFEIDLSTLSHQTVRDNFRSMTNIIIMQNCDDNSNLTFYNCQTDSKISKFVMSKSITDAITNRNVRVSYSRKNAISSKPLDITPVAISAHSNSIYLLVSDSDNLIYEFNSSNCKFIRSFCPSSLLNTPQSVCVDSRGNILVAGSEGESTKIMCLSPDGDVIQELHIPYKQCISIAVSSQFQISILCKRESYGLISY